MLTLRLVPQLATQVRSSSLLVFEGGGAVSQFKGVYSDYFTALKVSVLSTLVVVGMVRAWSE